MEYILADGYWQRVMGMRQDPIAGDTLLHGLRYMLIYFILESQGMFRDVFQVQPQHGICQQIVGSQFVLGILLDELSKNLVFCIDKLVILLLPFQSEGSVSCIVVDGLLIA